MPDYEEPCYTIGVIVRLLGIQPYIIRRYERMGLVSPSRTPGNIRLYSERDLGHLRQIRRLNDLGVNLAGVEIIMRLAARMMDMERQMAESRAHGEQMERELEEEIARLKQMVAPATIDSE